MNENELYVVKKYNFDNPPIQKINSIISECYRDCHHKYFHTFDFSLFRPFFNVIRANSVWRKHIYIISISFYSRRGHV